MRTVVLEMDLVQQIEGIFFGHGQGGRRPRGTGIHREKGRGKYNPWYCFLLYDYN